MCITTYVLYKPLKWTFKHVLLDSAKIMGKNITPTFFVWATIFRLHSSVISHEIQHNTTNQQNY